MSLDSNKILGGSVDLTAALEDELTLPNCPLGNSVLEEFARAKSYRVQSGVDERMRRAFYSSKMEYTPEAKCVINGVDIYVGLFARLRAILLAWHFDRVSSAGERQFTVKPTPVPEVPEEMKVQAIERVVQDLVNAGLPPEAAPDFMRERVAEVKANVMRDLYKSSEIATGKMQSAMLDSLVEADYLAEYFRWWTNFATYWGAIMEFPVVTERASLKWKNGKPVVSKEYPLGFKAISPLDFWITNDGTNTNNSRAVFVRGSTPHEELFRMLNEEQPGPIKTNLEIILSAEKDVARADWMLATPDNERGLSEGTSIFTSAPISGTYGTLRTCIKITGLKLKEYGITSISRPNKIEIQDNQLYDVRMWIINGRVVLLKPNSHPLEKRPFYVASYEPVTDTIYGNGLYDKVSNAERAACKAARDLVVNAEFTAGVIAEIDNSRFTDGSTPQHLTPWALYRTENSPIGGSPNAISMQSIPSKIGELIALYNHYDQMAQLDAGLNYMMAGASEGASWMRTNVAVDTVQGNSTKVINYRAVSADMQCFLPMFRDLWVYHMLYNPDESIKADASVDLKGLTSVASQDAQKAHQVELLQYLPAVIGALRESGQQLDGRFVAELVKNIMRDRGADTRYLEDPQDRETINRIVGSPTPAVTPPALDGRSAVPVSQDARNRLPAG